MRQAVGFIALVASAYFIYKSILKRKEIKDCNGKKVVATIVDNKMQPLSGGMYVYYPIYSYEIDGEMQTFQSSCPSAAALKMGMQVPMYYNENKRSPVEAVSPITDITLAMIFGALSMLFLN